MLKFDVAKTVKYWLEGAEYDIDVAKALYEKEEVSVCFIYRASCVRKTVEGVGCQNNAKTCSIYAFTIFTRGRIRY